MIFGGQVDIREGGFIGLYRVLFSAFSENVSVSPVGTENLYLILLIY